MLKFEANISSCALRKIKIDSICNLVAKQSRSPFCSSQWQVDANKNMHAYTLENTHTVTLWNSSLILLTYTVVEHTQTRQKSVRRSRHQHTFVLKERTDLLYIFHPLLDNSVVYHHHVLIDNPNVNCEVLMQDSNKCKRTGIPVSLVFLLTSVLFQY